MLKMRGSVAHRGFAAKSSPAEKPEAGPGNFAAAPNSQLKSRSFAHLDISIMKKPKKAVPVAGKSTSGRAFLKAARHAQRRATEAKRAARAAKAHWKAAKEAYRQAKDAAQAAIKAIRAAQKALPAAVREHRKAKVESSKRQ